MADKPKNSIIRINLSGRVNEHVFNYRQEIYKALDKEFLFLIIEDSNLGIKITPDKIHQEFSEGSFPREFLLSLSDDEEALQTAYELIMEVRK